MKQNTITLYTVLKFVFAAVFLLCGHAVMAQDPGGDPGLIPVDGGLAFLLAAGVGYGAKKAYDFKKGMRQKQMEKE